MQIKFSLIDAKEFPVLYIGDEYGDIDMRQSRDHKVLINAIEAEYLEKLAQLQFEIRQKYQARLGLSEAEKPKAKHLWYS